MHATSFAGGRRSDSGDRHVGSRVLLRHGEHRVGVQQRLRLGATPQRGGTLTMLGQSDIFNLDTVSAYYTVSSMLERMFTRQLFSYGVPTGAATPPPVVPDVATTIPTTANGGITDGGKTLTIHLRKGVMWNTTPARQVTAADFVREFKMLCNPVSPVGAPGYFTATIVGMESYCDGFAKVKGTASAISSLRQLARPAGRGRDQRPDPHVPPEQLHARLPVHPDHGLLLGPADRVHEVRPGQRHVPAAHALGRPVQDHVVRGGQVVHARAQPGLEGVDRPAPARLRQQDQHHRGPDLRQRAAAAESRARATWNGT